MMILMIFAGVVAMCGSVIDGVIIGNYLSADSMTAFGYASPVFIFCFYHTRKEENPDRRSKPVVLHIFAYTVINKHFYHFSVCG